MKPAREAAWTKDVNCELQEVQRRTWDEGRWIRIWMKFKDTQIGSGWRCTWITRKLAHEFAKKSRSIDIRSREFAKKSRSMTWSWGQWQIARKSRSVNEEGCNRSHVRSNQSRRVARVNHVMFEISKSTMKARRRWTTSNWLRVNDQSATTSRIIPRSINDKEKTTGTLQRMIWL